MKKLTPLSYEEHQEIAPKVVDIHRLVGKLLVKLSPAFGVTSREIKDLAKIHQLLKRLKSDLEERAYKVYPGQNHDEVLELYYPSKKRE